MVLRSYVVMDILKEAQSLTESILKMTKDLVLTGQKENEEVETDAYVKLMEDRQPLVDKLTELKKGIDSVIESSPEFDDIRQTIKTITDLDEEHIILMNRMNESAHTAHKDIKVRRKLHNAYMDNLPESMSRSFDTTQ